MSGKQKYNTMNVAGQTRFVSLM